jgi:hypothetical protein
VKIDPPRADEPTLRRLAFVKYLYTLGLEQSAKSEPLSSASLLYFHDAIEFFLQLAAETVDAPAKSGVGFIEYWEVLAHKIDGGITLKTAMQRLNKARVNLKHHGTLLTTVDVLAFRNSTTRFFTENTPRVFGVQLSDVSLVDLVLNVDVRNDLRAAEAALARNDLDESLKRSAIALQRLLDDFDRSVRDEYGRTSFRFGKELTHFSSHMLGLKSYGSPGNSTEAREIIALREKVAKFVDVMKDTVESIQDALKLLSLGLDYQRYVRFLAVTPHAFQTINSPEYKTAALPQELPVERREVEFCIEFVVESSLKLQDFALHIGY